MFGPQILARSLTAPRVVSKKDGSLWQYHGRSDRHSKVACWAIVFDLLQHCRLFRAHVSEERVFFGINHEMRDFKQDRKKNLDLVLCTPTPGQHPKVGSLRERVITEGIELDDQERAILMDLPDVRPASVGSVVMALEAKACMTEHSKARPRLYDELNSSHLTIHGDTGSAIAAGFAMINLAPTFRSPTRPGETTVHKQPKAALSVIEKLKQLPRRNGPGEEGFDALALVVVDCANDGSAVTVVSESPAPKPGELFHYASMIQRVSAQYAARFAEL